MAEIYDKAVGVRFAPVSKAYHFDANSLDLKVGDLVIVETARGRQIGEVVKVMDEFVNEGETLKPVERLATPRDLVGRELNNLNKDQLTQFCAKRIEELGTKGVKIMDCEFSFDGTRALVNYASDNDEKVDLKALRFDVQKQFPGVTGVDLHQLGPRDVAKNLQGMGACGLMNRCCSQYLTEFSSISIKMAKEQGISLTPNEITGMCGRLRCCLVYENDYYVECRKKLPKRNKRVTTPQGEGKVVEVFPLRDAVLVDLGPEIGKREFKREQLTFEVTAPQPAPVEKKSSEKKNPGKKASSAPVPEEPIPEETKPAEDEAEIIEEIETKEEPKEISEEE